MKKLAKDLRLGDVVRLAENQPFMDAIVCKVADDLVTFWRPYGRCETWSYGSPPQVICLMGLETFSRPMTDTATFRVLQNGHVYQHKAEDGR